MILKKVALVVQGYFFYTQKTKRMRGGEAWQEHQIRE